MLADLRAAVRGLRRGPGFSLLVVLVFALGIGVNVAAFGAVDALLFRPPVGVRDPGAVRRIRADMPRAGGAQVAFNLGLSLADLDALAARRAVFAATAGYVTNDAVVGRGAGARKVAVTLATGDYFHTLGILPALGRLLMPADAAPAATPAVVATHAFWRATLGADPRVVGHTIVVNDHPVTLVGVAEPGFAGVELQPTDLIASLGVGASVGLPLDGIRDPSFKLFQSVVRLAPGVDPRRAAGVATAALRAVDAAGPHAVLGFDARRGRVMRADPLHDYFGGGFTSGQSPVPLWMLGATGAVLLAVCANVANLLLVRAERRRREIATRLAVGAAAGRIIRQLFVEGVVLAACGGLLGLALAAAAAPLLRFVPGLPASTRIVDTRAALFALGATVLTTVAFALAPAVAAARGDARVLLRAGARQTASSGHARAVLLGIQFAASLTLLGTGGLFVRSLRNVRAVNVGFDAERTLVAQVDENAFGLRKDDTRRLLERAAERLRRTPGVAGAALVGVAPFRGASMQQFTIPERPDAARVSELPGGLFYTDAVSPDYFRALGIRLLRGRVFVAGEGADSTRPPPLVVSETFARRVWPDADAIGQCVHGESDSHSAGDGPAHCARVVGVVSDVRFISAVDAAPPLIYSPLAAQRSGPVTLVVRVAPTVAGGTVAFVPVVRAAVLAADPRVPFADVAPLATGSLLAAAFEPYRVSAAAFTLFGALALVLAAVGLYGVVAYAVAQRAGEFGIRMSLGARGRDVAALVLGQGLRTVAAGGVAGALGAMIVGRLLRAKLYGVGPLDPVSLAVTAAVLAGAALLAGWIPARRAARVDPASALRSV